MTYIFKQYIKTDTIFLYIDEHFEDSTENAYVKGVAESTIYHRLLDLVLEELDVTKRIIFLSDIDDETKHQGLLEKAQEWIEDFESKINTRVKEAELEILQLFK